MHATGNLINNCFMIDRYNQKCTTKNIARIRIMQFHFNIPRTLLKISAYRVSTCTSIGYLILYTVIIVKTIINNETKVFFSALTNSRNVPFISTENVLQLCLNLLLY